MPRGVVADHTTHSCVVQEVDTKVYNKYLLPLMQRRGFEGWYANKAGKVAEGSVLFYRSSLFQLVATCAPY